MKAAVITISDGCYHKKREDTSGQKLSQMLTENQWEVVSTHIVPDERVNIPVENARSSHLYPELVLTRHARWGP
jgi:molybdopterin biosynthesis enzyme MoaB